MWNLKYYLKYMCYGPVNWQQTVYSSKSYTGRTVEPPNPFRLVLRAFGLPWIGSQSYLDPRSNVHWRAAIMHPPPFWGAILIYCIHIRTHVRTYVHTNITRCNIRSSIYMHVYTVLWVHTTIATTRPCVWCDSKHIATALTKLTVSVVVFFSIFLFS